MTRVVYPSARLSANGAAALVDTVDRGVRVCDLPSGRLRWELGDEGDVAHACLSASGNALAWVGEDEHVAILAEAGRLTGEMPASRDRIRAIAVGDTGDRIAALVAAGAANGPDRAAPGLVVVPGPTRDGTLAAAEIPVFDNGYLLANDDCSLLMAGSSSSVGEQRSSGVFALAGGALRPLWTEGMTPGAQGALALYGEWLFAATADGLAGRRRSGDAVTVPGSLRERMIFSPDGGHLLAHRAEEVIDVTTARTLFRLIDLTSLAEVRRTNHLIEGRLGAQFVLDAGLGLVEVRVTRAGELAVKQLEWGRP